MAGTLKESGKYLLLAAAALVVVGCSGGGESGNNSCGERCFKLTASDGAKGDFFGESTAVEGDVIVIGSTNSDGFTQASGAAYVYRFDGDDWVHEQKLTASDGVTGDNFGGGVAIGGDVIVVSAEYNNHSQKGIQSGSAYVFRFDGTKWEFEQKLTASNGVAGDFFSGFVAVDNGVIAIEANGTALGSVYVYRFEGGIWVQEAELTASDGAANDGFGSSVALSGDLIVVGSDHDDDGGASSGSAYVYRRSGAQTGWIQEQKLTASDGAEGDRFGIAVTVDQGVVVVGAYSADESDGPDNIGSAYVYRYKVAQTEWIQEQKLTASDREANDFFGGAVTLDKDLIVVGADDKRNNGVRSGAAYVYRFDGVTWSEDDKLVARDGDSNDKFGQSVDVNGNFVVIGAYQDGDFSGSAYVFEL